MVRRNAERRRRRRAAWNVELSRNAHNLRRCKCSVYLVVIVTLMLQLQFHEMFPYLEGSCPAPMISNGPPKSRKPVGNFNIFFQLLGVFEYALQQRSWLSINSTYIACGGGSDLFKFLYIFHLSSPLSLRSQYNKCEHNDTKSNDV